MREVVVEATVVEESLVGESRWSQSSGGRDGKRVVLDMTMFRSVVHTAQYKKKKGPLLRYSKLIK